MPDISMCHNEECRKRFHCYRYLAKPDEWQSYSSFVSDSDTKRCEYYIHTDTKKNKHIALLQKEN